MSWKSKICVTCLSSDRRLTPLHKTEAFIHEFNYLELKTSKGGICWECQSILMKFHKFKLQVRTAQETLKNNLKHEITPLSKLSHKLNLNYDYEYNYLDPLTSDVDPKAEVTDIKEEPPNVGDEHDDDDEIGDVIESVYVDVIKTKSRRKCVSKNVENDAKTKSNKKSSIPKEHEGKFIQVVFTEDEMLKNREDKRNHPNFKKIPYKCDSCVLGFTRKETYNVHVEKKHDENIGTEVCDVCQIRFSNSLLLAKHRRKHYICYKCTLCKHASSELWSVLNHCKVKHSADGPDKIHCTQCDVVVKTPEDLEQHIQTQHTLYCNECGVKFKGMNTLRRHKARIHAIKREFICEVCSKTFATKTRLESHMVAHSAHIARSLAYCRACRVQYKNIHVYRNHLKYSKNHSERAYSCPKCNKKFASKVYWNRHYNFYHLKKSQFHCEICNKLFISDWLLKTHRQKHHGLSRSRDHACTVCGKKFFTISTLRSHQLTHSEQRSYMCEDCGDTFKQRPALYTHARLVHSSRGRRKYRGESVTNA